MPAFKYKKGKFIAPERRVLHAATKYMKLAYPKLLYHFDFGGDALLTGRQAAENKRIQKRRAFPELHLYEARRGFIGFVIDLKRIDVKIYNKSGLFASEHLSEQDEWFSDLRKLGYLCKFLKGFDTFKTWLDWYMQGEKTEIKIPVI